MQSFSRRKSNAEEPKDSNGISGLVRGWETAKTDTILGTPEELRGQFTSAAVSPRGQGIPGDPGEA
jgi:hypothetical protein